MLKNWHLIKIHICIICYETFFVLFFRDNAEAILQTAKQVLDALEEAREAQERAEIAIDKANNDIKAADIDLAQVSRHL